MTKNLQSTNLLSLCYEQEKAELQCRLQREEKIFESLRKVVEETKELQVLELEKRHAKGVGSLKKRHGLHIWEEMKLLRDKHKDKNELSRYQWGIVLDGDDDGDDGDNDDDDGVGVDEVLVSVDGDGMMVV